MTASFTPNIQLTEPARGDDVGTWDTPVNNNTTVLDLVAGGITTISLNNSPIVLSAAQFQAKQITFNSTLTGSVTITFPTSFTKSYEIQNLCTGSSAFVITLQTTASGQVICCPPGETIDCFNDGGNIKFKNLARIGSYWDFAGSSVPAWVSGCTVAPYLNCDGTTFSSATYPVLAMILGGNTLPNSQGKYRLTLNQGASTPISSATGAGFTASSVGIVGGGQATTLSSQNMPPVPITDPGHAHTPKVNNAAGGSPNPENLWLGNNGTLIYSGGSNAAGGATNTATTGITAGSSAPTSFTNLPPSYVGGLALIRAA